MSEIRDRARIKLDDLYAKHGRLNISDGQVTLEDEGWQDFLSMPEIAIVDREAELPKRDHKKPRSIYGYEEAQQDMLKAGWVKEIKE